MDLRNNTKKKKKNPTNQLYNLGDLYQETVQLGHLYHLETRFGMVPLPGTNEPTVQFGAFQCLGFKKSHITG